MANKLWKKEDDAYHCPIAALGTPDAHVRGRYRTDKTTKGRHHGAVHKAQIEQQWPKHANGKIIRHHVRTEPHHGHLRVPQI